MLLKVLEGDRQPVGWAAGTVVNRADRSLVGSLLACRLCLAVRVGRAMEVRREPEASEPAREAEVRQGRLQLSRYRPA